CSATPRTGWPPSLARSSPLRASRRATSRSASSSRCCARACTAGRPSRLPTTHRDPTGDRPMPPQVVRPRVTTKFLGSARTLKGIDDKRRVLRHRISAQIVDRDGDVVVSSGGQVKAFLEHNPVVFLNHAARGLPIARSLDVITGRTEVEAETQFAGLDQMHPTAETVYRLSRAAFMHARPMGVTADTAHVSREAMFPGQRGRTIKQWELLEYSAVGIPANPQAKSAMVQSLIAKGLLTLPDGATDEDLGKALGTIPLAKYWQAT